MDHALIKAIATAAVMVVFWLALFGALVGLVIAFTDWL